MDPIKKSPWGDLHHQVWRWMKESHLLKGAEPLDEWLVAFSGGLDSCVLTQILFDMASAAQIRLHLVYVHHGAEGGFDGVLASGAKTKAGYRDQAALFCHSWAKARGLELTVLGPSSLPLKSEDDLREFRWNQLRSLRERRGSRYIVTGHHLDDLLETRLLRLIRGTGPFGLRGMSKRDGSILRPLLDRSRAELKSWSETVGLDFFEDPTNSESHYLRNWLRNEWLPILEKRVPGGVASLSRSLALIQEALEPALEVLKEDLDEPGRIPLPAWRELSKSGRRQLLWRHLRLLKKKPTQGQLMEAIKRVGEGHRGLDFSLLACHWSVNAGQLLISPDQGEIVEPD